MELWSAQVFIILVLFTNNSEKREKTKQENPKALKSNKTLQYLKVKSC